MAVARRAGGADSFPEYFHVARNLPEETELQVHEEAVRTRTRNLFCRSRLLTFRSPAFRRGTGRVSCRFSQEVHVHDMQAV